MSMVETTRPLTQAYKDALVHLLLVLADDDLAFGHRSSQWLGLAPDLEEDIAFSSIAQDEIGHAAFFYRLVSDLAGEDADALAFARPTQVRKNARLLEQQNGDWAYTIARAYVYNIFEQVRLEALLASNYLPLQQGATKILREERYHRLHMETWFLRLAEAGGEARFRLETAVEHVWADLSDLFTLGNHQHDLIHEGILPTTEQALYEAWLTEVKPMFDRSSLYWPGNRGELTSEDLSGATTAKVDGSTSEEERNGRLGQHSEHLDELLQTMTEVYRSEAGATW
ncbi:1,2-phenylacetyl-CoA epoxidase subunit PaaC [Alicyclobacillus mengziensis]|uniref:Phenylacetate-CoA oxygenase subunit PaaC n=1 Tax=Alicyclobacillus mengziensis TaxID=2931921 RepID=A0A9X7W048_9BACL|nr:1,2-phenylacetyl-CoA epoxidase subunit PaaC [Alicyclobacillus mengziensis]QSO47790.1 phenylacetate-CoA oxygenase subunit PaaC [Alicyclobacillus mengziensis]